MHYTLEQKGKYNKNYTSVLFHFDTEDKHFFNRKDKNKCNYMPKWNELELMIEKMIMVEPLTERENKKNRLLNAIEQGMTGEIINQDHKNER